MNLLNHKKGFLIDGLVIGVSVLVVALVVIFGYMLYSEMNADIQADDNYTTNAKALMSYNYDRYVVWWDWLFLLFVMGSFLASFISAMIQDIHPAFFVLSFFVFIVIVIGAGLIGNVFYDFTQGDLAVYLAPFTFIPYIMSNFLPIVIIFGVLDMIALYGRSR